MNHACKWLLRGSSLPVADAELLRHQGVGAQRKRGIPSVRSHHVGPFRHQQVHEGLIEAKLRTAFISALIIPTEHHTGCMGKPQETQWAHDCWSAGARKAGSPIEAAMDAVVAHISSITARSCSMQNSSAVAMLRILASHLGWLWQFSNTLNAHITGQQDASCSCSVPPAAKASIPATHSSKSPAATIASISGRCVCP